MMKRREFITLLGGAAAAWPIAARAQQPKLPVIGFMSSRSAKDSVELLQSFHRGLREAGYVEGQNVAIEHRWAEGRYERLPELAAELVNRQVAVIAAFGGGPSARAAKAATLTIPIVISIGDDPIEAGFVKSLNRPDGNITGVMLFTSVIGSKRLGLLRELVPQGGAIALLANLATTSGQTQKRDIEKTAHEIGQRLVVMDARTDDDFDKAFATFARERVAALMVAADPFFDTRRDRIIELVAKHRWPAIYQFRDYVLAGGLMSYGASILETYFQNGVYVGRILGGAKPADMPILLPTKFELVINMKTANAIGVAIPPGVLAIADEVIE
jgi:putative tryptophan/tyrosine transport system substrate-binding protein